MSLDVLGVLNAVMHDENSTNFSSRIRFSLDTLSTGCTLAPFSRFEIFLQKKKSSVFLTVIRAFQQLGG